MVHILDTKGNPFEIAVRDTVQQQAKRIFQEGLKSDGTKIGTYESTKPIYVSDNAAPKKVNHKGKTGKTIKYGYYESYKAFREAMGRESSFVNLRLTNDLQSDFSNVELSKTSNAVAKAKPIQLTSRHFITMLKREENKKKKDGFDVKYGKIFDLTIDEKKNLEKIAILELKLAHARLFPNA
jgi:hypothetical protein